MVVLVTGGAGFIGRWVVKKLIEKKIDVVVIDNLSNGQEKNLEEFKDSHYLKEFIIGDICNKELVDKLYSKYQFEKCFHLAAQINVQESLDFPDRAFRNNIIGTYTILEASRRINTKVIILGTCMVYNLADSNEAISETHEVKSLSPYAGSKVAAENLAISYYYGLNLPIVILRPFNTYGPYQKTNMEGGVVSIFVKNKLTNKKLKIFGDGTQTRDLLYVEDCADFIYEASENEKCVGEIINAGTGKDISIKDLAILIVNDENQIEYVEHHHPQAEINKLLCDNHKAKELLGWQPKISLKEGIKKLENWLKKELN